MLLYPRLPKSAERGLFVPAPVSVNVGDSKRDLGEGKGDNLETKTDFWGLEFLGRLIKDVMEIGKDPGSTKRSAFVAFSGDGRSKGELDGI